MKPMVVEVMKFQLCLGLLNMKHGQAITKSAKCLVHVQGLLKLIWTGGCSGQKSYPGQAISLKTIQNKRVPAVIATHFLAHSSKTAYFLIKSILG